jgi:hypothetical protein
MTDDKYLALYEHFYEMFDELSVSSRNLLMSKFLLNTTLPESEFKNYWIEQQIELYEFDKAGV